MTQDEILKKMIEEFDEKWTAFKLSDMSYGDAVYLGGLLTSIKLRIRMMGH